MPRPTIPLRFPPSSSLQNMHHFDTYKFVNRLEEKGFSREASEAIMNSVADVVTESVSHYSSAMVSRTEFEKTVYMNKVDFNQIRNEMTLLEQNDLTLLRSDISRLNAELTKTKTRIIEDLRRLQSDVRLELSLEKGRVRDDQANQQLKIKEAESEIDHEVSNLKTQMETIKWEMFRTLIPLFTASGALFFSKFPFPANYILILIADHSSSICSQVT